ncbi:EAL domain-containing protein [Lysinibacillus odysseyi]|uniref:bifunctional diguanylate cyclase/phosphodiesterase n=1 Tax=Lysinibacillus odysseyi TaxID=202611 RepID=UPI00068F59DA|nr:EAL domain-containing protein [Lysinibacillus odysseyi]
MKKTEEKGFVFRHLRKFLLVNAVGILIFLNYDMFYQVIGENNITMLKIIVQIFMLVAIISVGIQIWFSTRFNLDIKNVHMGALFFTIGIFQVVHIMTLEGMPNYLYYDYGRFSDLFDLMTHNLLPLGMIVVFSIRYRYITFAYRKRVFSTSIVIAMLFVILCFWQIPFIHQLFVQFNLKVMLQTSSIIVQLVLIALLIWKFEWSHKKNFLFLIATSYFLIGNGLFSLSASYTDAYYFMGEMSQVCAFATLFYGIYYASVERPYRKLEASEMRMQKMAYYDEVTGLPNHRYLEEKLEEDMPVSKSGLTILLIEVERLDAIEISFGQKHKNVLVKTIADRFQSVLKEGQLLVKFAKNQFIIYVKQDCKKEARRICEALRQILEQPIQLHHYSLRVKLYTGIAVYPNDAQRTERLIKCAQYALNKAKTSGPGHVAFYTSEIELKNRERLQLEHDLEKALINNELFLEYQPQLEIRTNEIRSVEALVRWQHPRMGRIAPDHFISIAEESGLIIPLGLAVLKMACRDMKRWEELHGKAVKVAVNLSLSQLYQENFSGEVRKILTETGWEAAYLQLEITESMTYEVAQMIPVLDELKALGVTVAIDDFGTGYSSLSYLTDFPFDCLKIDRSFVDKIGISKKGEAIVTTILAMAKHLNVKVVAEGIETVEQFMYLEDAGCDKIQGYYVSKPLPFNELIDRYDGLLARVYSVV